MKKLSIYFLIIICLFMTGCGDSDKVKEVATIEDFNTAAINNGFTTNDNTDTYKNIDYILNSTKVVYDDIELEMVEYIDSDYASKAQESHIESFNLLKSTGAHGEKDKGSNYYRYVLVSNGRYMISTRVDNTLIFGKVLIEDKEIVEKLIDEIGY